MDWSGEEINALYKQVMVKASTDSEFRNELLTDTDKAIGKMAGKKLPEGFKVKVIEKDPGYAETFILPDLVSGELYDNQLDAVAGGSAFPHTMCPIHGCYVEAEEK